MEISGIPKAAIMNSNGICNFCFFFILFYKQFPPNVFRIYIDKTEMTVLTNENTLSSHGLHSENNNKLELDVNDQD